MLYNLFAIAQNVCLPHKNELKQRRRRRLEKRRLKMNLYFSYKFREWLDVFSTGSSNVRMLLRPNAACRFQIYPD